MRAQVASRLFDPGARLKSWDSVFIGVGINCIGIGSSSDKALARALSHSVAADEAHTFISLADCSLKAVAEHAGRKHVMVVSVSPDPSGANRDFIFSFDDPATRDSLILRLQVRSRTEMFSALCFVYVCV
jgi:hypothetical protein